MTTTTHDTAPPAAAIPNSPHDTFAPRHLGPRGHDLAAMLDTLGVGSLEELIEQTIPTAIRREPMRGLPEGCSETQALSELKAIASRNQVFRSFIGMGYHGTITPPPILRNVLENPLWYTPYTPYQAEISQGRLEALLNFQTMVSDLTAMPLANASLLDEATAAAEAMAMCKSIAGATKNIFIVDGNTHPQTIAVMQTRAESLGIQIRVARSGYTEDLLPTDDTFGVLIQYPGSDGRIPNGDALNDIVDDTHKRGGLVVAACDILALTLLKPPGEWGSGGADIAVGSTQRFGVPMGYGGPHAAYMATKHEYARKMPGRVVGVSKDAHGNPAFRLALQTREQHIRREKATSNICTAQVLLAVMASMYAVYHGPQGLRRIARRVHDRTATLAAALRAAGATLTHDAFFDTLGVRVKNADDVLRKAREQGINLRRLDETTVGISLDEAATDADVMAVAGVFGARVPGSAPCSLPPFALRESSFLTHPIFNSHHHEHELLRYITKLQRKDISLADSMIPLGSCTMKLNAAAEMIPITWPRFADVHPFAPSDQAQGYRKLFDDLEHWLAICTGFDAVSLQPNAGSQGEYAGLLAIRAFHRANGEHQREICLIPTSAHGTNPASAVIAGMHVVAVACDDNGNVDVADLRQKAEMHAERLACLMVTYPSTHGVFESAIKDACAIVHEHGGHVYMDGANMNAQVGLTSPAAIGADVCHLNLHKTFCIPHGGGGPGMGPIAVKAHLAPHLPASGAAGGETTRTRAPVVSGAPFGSALILPIPWMYIRMMGGEGLTRATQIAILNANYMAARLKEHYPVLYRGQNGRVAHEFIIDCRDFEKVTAGAIRVEDIAKRLMDFGFHAPTMSFPVPGTLMIEPTESEPKHELDRLCDALIAIRREIDAVEKGQLHREDNPLKNAPHTAAHVTADDWPHPYSRRQAAYPLEWVRDAKFWPSVGRIDNAYGDRNLICTCPGVEDVAATSQP